jgi:hypothetical protein
MKWNALSAICTAAEEDWLAVRLRNVKKSISPGPTLHKEIEFPIVGKTAGPFSFMLAVTNGVVEELLMLIR